MTGRGERAFYPLWGLRPPRGDHEIDAAQRGKVSAARAADGARCAETESGSGCSALHVAGEGHLEICRLLVDAAGGGRRGGCRDDSGSA